MYMRVKLLPRDLNPNSCLPHPTSTYTCRVTTAPKVRGGALTSFLISHMILFPIPTINKIIMDFLHFV